MATYDPQRNRGRRPVHDDEPAAVDELLGIADEPAAGEPSADPTASAARPGPVVAVPTPVVPTSTQPESEPAPEPVTVVPTPTPAPLVPRTSVPPATTRRGTALPALAMTLVAIVVAWLLWRLRRRS